MAEWYDLMAELSAEETSISPMTDSSVLPEVLSVPANNSNEIDLEEYYSYAGYDDNGKKIITENPTTENAGSEPFQHYYGQYQGMQQEEQAPSMFNPDVISNESPSGRMQESESDIVPVTQNHSQHLVVGTVSQQQSTVAPPVSASTTRETRPFDRNSLQHKMASNPYFNELFDKGTIPSYPPPPPPQNPQHISGLGKGPTSSLSPSADPIEASLQDLYKKSAAKYDSTTNHTTNLDVVEQPTTTRVVPKKRLHYIPPPAAEVNVWDDSSADKETAKALSKQFVFTKMDVKSPSMPEDNNGPEDSSDDDDNGPEDTSSVGVTLQVGFKSSTHNRSATGAARGGNINYTGHNMANTSINRTSVFTLGGVISTEQANKVLYSAGEAILFVKDQAFSSASRYIASNMYICSFIGCVNESLYYAADRAKTYTDAYLNTLTSDDPEKRHLARIKNSTHWQNILLRYSMASLTWKQRQLLEETRDGGTLDQMDLNNLMKDARTKPQSQQGGGGSGGGGGSSNTERLMRIADEYFYITTAPDSHHNNSQCNASAGGSHSAKVSSSTGGKRSLTLTNGGTMDDHGDSDNENEIETVVVHKNKARFSSNILDRNAETLDILGGDASRSTVAMEFIQSNIHAWLENEASGGDDDAQYALARFFTAPAFSESNCCCVCSRAFGITLFRHHCRFCGQSVCEDHSKDRRCIYRFGMIQPVRVCSRCKTNIDEIHRRDSLIWRESRVQAYLNCRLIPYFNPTVDRGIDKALRIADYSIIVAKNTLALNFPTKVVLETVDILKRYGLSGFAGLLLRQDFLESVETLKRISGMDAMFSMSLHELTACIYYKLAIDRGLRGCNPEGERIAHAPHISAATANKGLPSAAGVHSINSYHHGYGYNNPGGSGRNDAVYGAHSANGSGNRPHTDNVFEADYDCDTAKSEDIDRAIRFAALALKIVYEINPVDCQRLAKTQGWETLFSNAESDLQPEQPCYVLFASELPVRSVAVNYGSDGEEEGNDYRSSIRDHKHSNSNSSSNRSGHSSRHNKFVARKEAVLAIRGTKTIQDVVTDIRAAPQEFPPPPEEIAAALNGDIYIDNRAQAFNSAAGNKQSDNNNANDDDEADDRIRNSFSSDMNDSSGNNKSQWEWLSVSHTSTYACGGFSRAAVYVLRECGPSLVALYKEGYDITITGHSLGGGVAALVTYMLRTAIPNIQCVTYGCPSCVDATTADVLKNHVLTVINHDDVISRITPHSIRGLMSELMIFREQVFKHIQQDWRDVMIRAYSLWSPRWRQTHSKLDLTSHTANSSNAFEALTIKNKATGTSLTASVARSTTITTTTNKSGASSAAYRDSVHSPSAALSASTTSSNDTSTSSGSVGEDSSMVVVEQEVLPDLWVPGRIVHLFLHKGQYHASEVSRTFPDIRRIEVQGNMFEDHRSKNTLDALLEARAVRHAPSVPPDWIPYNNADLCYCCHNPFTWHSTFRGDAQEYRDRFNCKHCGNVVCGPCSKGRRAIPKYGMLFDERICDHCLYKGDFAIVR